MIPTAATTPANAPTCASAMIGISSLILEGRALSDDNYSSNYTQPITNAQTINSNNPTGNSYTSQRMDSSDNSLQHIQRMRQKLGQLRQSSPGTSRENLAEHEIIVGPNRNICNTLTSTQIQDDSYDNELCQYVQRKPKTNQQIPDNNLLYTLQSLASTCLRTTPRPFLRNRDNISSSSSSSEFWFNSNSNSSIRSFGSSSSSCSSNSLINSNHMNAGSSNCTGSYQSVFMNKAIVKIQRLNRGEKIASPKQGPHCDQFLKKLGLNKGEASETEEHICDMANLNEICYRWQLHCRQIEVIMSRSDPICIEVYLGPENHEILLEQWIIQKEEKSIAPNMTLQSLCNAIRSQLYFSQITSWCDLLRKTNYFDKEIQENGRIKTSNKVNLIKKSYLDIFYRIKSFDSTACFNSKPNVHNFPNVIIAENCSISVCLKSLPRLQGGIPKIGDFLSTYNVGSCNNQTQINNIDHIEQQHTTNRDDTMMLDDRLNLPCQEKGKHKCAFDEEEGSSDTVTESVCSTNMTHREKQLIKYKKRMMKRDKKMNKKSTDISKTKECQQMQLEEKNIPEYNIQHNSESINTQAMHEFISINSINSIRPPLYQTTTNVAEAVQTNCVEMVSIGTQTSDFPMILPSCEICGHNMQFVCWNCEKKSTVEQCQNEIQISNPPKIDKADLLLQAIQRTPQKKINNQRNNNNTSEFRPLSNQNPIADCQLCKRQKTGHNYNFTENEVNNGITTNGVTNGISVKPMSSKSNILQSNNHISDTLLSPILNSMLNSPTCTRKNQFKSELDDENDDQYTGVKKCNCYKSKDAHSNGICVLDNSIKYTQNGDCVPSIKTPLTPSTNTTFNNNDISAQFKTPKAHFSPKNQLKPTILPLNCSNEKNMKLLPKVNLSNIFCNSSSPIPINTEAFTFDDITPDIPVQKSNSAPTLPNSPSLSPRFLKQAAIYKRRSRHLSDRSSDRSSFGSDEQFSDEDLDSLYSPASSPIKTRTFLRCNIFGKKPLLGNLEESLLQRRFIPKTQVSGFKVLLGASGSFCPTQLTIPATAYFYELSGQTLSTPYVCEIRLSRKGYTIPRVGTVQATLLNPLGTVVRMFVVPYDFHDMPTMSQTFIRQRILAINSETKSSENSTNQNPSTSSSSSKCEMSFSEQMRSLRYSIHLRFQTSRNGRLTLHTDIRFLISRRTDCDTAAAHAKGALESPNDLKIVNISPEHPKYSARQENLNKI